MLVGHVRVRILQVRCAHRPHTFQNFLNLRLRYEALEIYFIFQDSPMSYFSEIQSDSTHIFVHQYLASDNSKLVREQIVLTWDNIKSFENTHRVVDKQRIYWSYLEILPRVPRIDSRASHLDCQLQTRITRIAHRHAASERTARLHDDLVEVA